MIRFEDVSIRRGNKILLENISFHIRRGEKLALMGPSGSGKSTLLLALLGTLPLSTGQIFFQGKEVNSFTIKEVRHSLAYIGQEPILGAESVREAIMLPFSFQINQSRKPTVSRVEDVLCRVGLEPEILNSRCSVVSGGEKQRLVIARALLLEKQMFLVDEVTSALDEKSRQVVLDIFSAAELTVFSVAHDPKWLARCDRLLEVHQGKVIEKK